MVALIDASTLNSRDEPIKLTQSQRGSHAGTWAHPKLAVYFARWLDVKFSVWCDMQIDELIRGCKTDPSRAPQRP